GAVSKVQLGPLPLIREFALHPTLPMLVGAGSETLEVFELTGTGLRLEMRTSVSPNSIPHISFSPSGKFLLVSYFDAKPDVFQYTYRVFGIDIDLW
ncbi:MAG TPA: hypothetical protein VIV60_24305, partial [Polyangiaceae bacterium]